MKKVHRFLFLVPYNTKQLFKNFLHHEEGRSVMLSIPLSPVLGRLLMENREKEVIVFNGDHTHDMILWSALRAYKLEKPSFKRFLEDTAALQVPCFLFVPGYLHQPLKKEFFEEGFIVHEYEPTDPIIQRFFSIEDTGERIRCTPIPEPVCEN